MLKVQVLGVVIDVPPELVALTFGCVGHARASSPRRV